MFNLKRLLPLAVLTLVLGACSNSAAKAENAGTDADTLVSMKPTDDKYVQLHTTMGDIVVRLYGDTPRHQANFIKLVKEGYYDNVLFHRVINDFMVQTGDPDSRDAKPGQKLGGGGPDYQIEAEIVYPKHYHKRGALAAARQGDQVNPRRASSGSQFYIVTGAKVSPAMMEQLKQQYAFRDKQEEFQRLASSHMEQIRAMQMQGDTAGLNKLQRELVAQVEAKFAGQPGPSLPQEIIDTYINRGGTPHLDGTYTVFGEVVSGMDVVDRIQKVQTDGNDRPVEDIRILGAKVITAEAAKAAEAATAAADSTTTAPAAKPADSPAK